MSTLAFVSDEVLERELKKVFEKAVDAKSGVKKTFGKNVIDPFSAMFEIGGFRIEHSVWYEAELTRQAQKTLQNHVGTFHQSILGAVAGWHDTGAGGIVDVVNMEKKILAEVKNKYNTLSGGQLAGLYESLESVIAPKTSHYKDFTAYYVTIIPKNNKRFDKPFTPSNKNKGTRCPENPLIRMIDGPSFYTLVTGRQNALQELYHAIPIVAKKLGYDIDSPEVLTEYFNKAFS
ncbi:Eco47II family restriction endonuclease [Yersinia ruckeri]|uniref:Eco47II family restriction endonuclease n=1 Tax=Yersinia ruckeri TaxID=29486 RepID=UPI001F2196E3|nr:Eco47II family restriction endonuclease [Yersinia ruckeri]MCK8538313.1 Eco47II family restriction endonuclease [Yersinia ruckeri]MCK8570059.1 Eco47II family restriction endonuclease [Yersinia ruckeri]MCK8573858.1 Eco47II family restriction endonuclease [Yersinia ruckeri]MCK8576639.1 Eco47II family restriction endonuclease [Yersinia ruckeri]MCK8580049.1 Eco47II family restriction endonuclease [Yersinia ruckeri]